MEQLTVISTHRIPTDEQFVAWADEARSMIAKYGWEDRKVAPYGHAESLVKMVDDIGDAEACTYDSKEYLWSLADGLTRILNIWEENIVNGYDVVNPKTGEITRFDRDLADLLVSECGWRKAE
jgi:hypothetical protein